MSHQSYIPARDRGMDQTLPPIDLPLNLLERRIVDVSQNDPISYPAHGGIRIAVASSLLGRSSEVHLGFLSIGVGAHLDL
jgi:hypothetical protein